MDTNSALTLLRIAEAAGQPTTPEKTLEAAQRRIDLLAHALNGVTAHLHQSANGYEAAASMMDPGTELGLRVRGMADGTRSAAYEIASLIVERALSGYTLTPRVEPDQPLTVGFLRSFVDQWERKADADIFLGQQATGIRNGIRQVTRALTRYLDVEVRASLPKPPTLTEDETRDEANRSAAWFAGGFIRCEESR